MAYLVCILGNVLTGLVITYSAVCIYQLSEERKLSLLESALISSLPAFGLLFTAFFIGFSSNHFGRRKTTVCLLSLSCAGWTIIWQSQGSIPLISLGQSICGLSIATSVHQVYLTEVAPLHLRGLFGNSGPTAVSFGTALVVMMGKALPWYRVALVCALLCLFLAIVYVVWMPESPNWFVIHKREDEAREVLVRLRGHDSVDEELNDLRNAVAQNNASQSFSALCRDLRRKNTLRPFLTLIAILFLAQVSGGNPVQAFGVNIAKELGFDTDPYTPAIVIGLIRTAAGIGATVALKAVHSRLENPKF